MPPDRSVLPTPSKTPSKTTWAVSPSSWGLYEDAGLDVRLSTLPPGAFALGEAAAFANFPDVGVPGPGVGAKARRLLDGTVGGLA